MEIRVSKYVLTESKPSKLDPYKAEITMWLEDAPYSSMQIWAKVRGQGLKG